jgi:putative membrane protein
LLSGCPSANDNVKFPRNIAPAEHLANERTFLAWVRTNIALTSLGFVLTRLGPWLRDSGLNTPRLASKAWSLGIGLVGFGAVLTLLAAWRYDAVNREIETGLVKTDRLLVWFVAVAIAVISGALIVYIQQPVD